MWPFIATCLVWAAWAISWTIAAGWSKRTAATAPRGDQIAYRSVINVGFIVLLIFWPLMRRLDPRLPGQPVLWPVSEAAAWALVAVTIAGFGFCWWARIALGANWSSDVTRKDDHQIIEAGPYRLTRHPIYTGLLLATYALAIEIARPSAVAGAVLVTVGYWMKAKLEERFLVEELGRDAYAAYRGRTPMLIPFWPIKG